MHYHLLGSGLILWSCWQISTVIGIVAGPTIPDSFQLGFAVPLTFIAVVIPSLTHFPQIFAGVSSGTAALIFQFLPFNLWIIISAICGIIAGTSSSYLMHARDTKNGEKP
jgi:predicted branched-subunit amino acid permease